VKRHNLVFLFGGLAAMVAIAIGGCENKVSQCTKDSDCPQGTCDLTVNRCAFASCAGGSTCPVGTFCNPPVASLCLPIPDGGTNDCAPACPAYQLCLASQCQNIYTGIAITQPSDNTLITSGTNVVAQLSARPGFPRQDPSALSLLVSFDGGSTTGQLQSQSGGVYQGAYVPGEDGLHQLIARYDAASLSSAPIRVTVNGTICTPNCPSHQQCLGGQCQNRYSGISITQPANGVFLDGGTPVVAQLIVNPGFARQDPPTLDLAVTLPDGGPASGMLPIDVTGNFYQGALAPTGDGLYQLIARYVAAGLSSPAVRVTILTIPPSFVLNVPPPPMGPDAGNLNYTDPGIGTLAWRRDQVIPLSISSTNANLVPGSVSLTVTGVNGPRTASPPVVLDAGCGFPYCATAQVDLSQPDMNAFRGTFGLSVVGTDRAGNVGRTDGGVTGTRWKWAFQTPDRLPIQTSPAIGSAGTVYVGTGTSTPTPVGTAYAINPDGTIKWSRDGGSMLASFSVGELDGGIEAVYVAMNDATSTTLRAFSSNAGEDFANRCMVPGGSIRASLAVTKIGGLETCFAAVNAGTGGVMLAYQPLAPPAVACIDGGSVIPGGQLLEPAAIAIDSSNNAYFALSSLRVQSLLFNGAWQTRSGWPVDAGANNAALAIASGTIVGAATTASGGDGGVFTYSAGGVIGRVFDGGIAWNPSATSGSVVLWAEENPARLTAGNIGSGSTVQTTNAGLSRGAPAIGKDAVIYVGDSLSNAISARDPLTLGSVWSVSSFGGGLFNFSLALDCSRAGDVANPGRPGVLYAADTQQNLFCFITDSRGIDPMSLWPKYQHDPRNTGNEQTPRMPFSCP